jgi:urea transport system ATP-binding protein
MDFIRSLSCPVTVLHEGHVLCEGNMDQVQSDPRVIEVYLGAPDEELAPQHLPAETTTRSQR